MRVLYIYKWCTFGGVERVLLNRAFAFRRFGMDVKSDLFFVYPGVQAKLQEYILKHNLQNYISVVSRVDPANYDIVISIDTEEAFDIVNDRKITLEVHTTYKDHIKYIESIDFNRLEKIIVPSDYIIPENIYIKNIDVPVYSLPNFVIDEGFEDEEKFLFPSWNLTPVCYLGRIDNHKNPHFILEAFYRYKDHLYDRILFCNIGYVLDHEYINLIEKFGLKARVLLFPNITFDKVKALINFLKKKNGLFVSASIAESFGMSVAESIYFGLPVLISDIPSHRKLVDEDERFLFSLKDHEGFVRKLDYILDNYTQLSSSMQKFARKLEPENFIAAWKKIFSE